MTSHQNSSTVHHIVIVNTGILILIIHNVIQIINKLVESLLDDLQGRNQNLVLL